MTISEKERFGKTVQLQTLTAVALSHTSAIFWGCPQRGRLHKLRGETIFFLDCGEGSFAVTADHVYQSYLDTKEEDPTTVSMVNGRFFPMEEYLIDRDTPCDLATFRITAEQATTALMPKTAHQHPAVKWPPPAPEEGALLMVSGFPARERMILDWNTIEIGLDCYGFVASSLNDRAIICQYNPTEFLDYAGNPRPMVSPELGGLSGGPVWQLNESPSGIATIQLAGIVKEYHADLGLLYVRRAEFLTSDGRIERSRFW